MFIGRDGKPLAASKGELVCTVPFASMPVKFWNDPDGEKYHAAYFERFPGIWHHGDFAEWTPHGGMIIHGRSDATLNPGGVRIGTAEIYAAGRADSGGRSKRSVSARIGMAMCGSSCSCGSSRRDSRRWTAGQIRSAIRTALPPRHVPAKIVAIADIPRTRSGKITELAVRDMVHGRPVKNTEALANPEALALYEDLLELRSDIYRPFEALRSGANVPAAHWKRRHRGFGSQAISAIIFSMMALPNDP